MAYIIGVYLGDGSIGTNKRTFCLQTIDKDFVEKTFSDISTLTKNNPKVITMPRLTTAKRVVYGMYVTDVTLCNELKKITNNRNNLPIDFGKWARSLQLELISGLLDSEGYVSLYRDHIYNSQRVFSMAIGIGATGTWLYELHQFLKENRMGVGVITREILKSGKIYAKFSFNKKDFIANGLYFNIFRKQNRIEEYKKIFPGSTTTRGIPRTSETKSKISKFASSRYRKDGKFTKLGNDIV